MLSSYKIKNEFKKKTVFLSHERQKKGPSPAFGMKGQREAVVLNAGKNLLRGRFAAPEILYYSRASICAISRSAKPAAVSPSWGTASSAASRTAAFSARAMCLSSMPAARSSEEGFA